MKKLALLLCLLILLLAACGSEQPATDSSQELHPHTFTQPGANGTHHFMACECGERSDLEAHDLDEDDFCSHCGFYIYDMGDGCYSFYIPDEQGHIVIQQDYNANEDLFYDWRAEYEYYEDSNPKTIREYLDGVLQCERTFLRCEDPDNGEVYMAEEIIHYEDGGKETYIYDEHFLIQSITMTDSIGQIVAQETYTYDLNADGFCTHEIAHTNGILSREIFYEVDSTGGYYPARILHYDENGQIESEFHFDEFGNELQ